MKGIAERLARLVVKRNDHTQGLSALKSQIAGRLVEDIAAFAREIQDFFSLTWRDQPATGERTGDCRHVDARKPRQVGHFGALG